MARRAAVRDHHAGGGGDPAFGDPVLVGGAGVDDAPVAGEHLLVEPLEQLALLGEGDLADVTIEVGGMVGHADRDVGQADGRVDGQGQ